MTGQQIARFASGRLRQSHERLQLADTLESLLAHRHRETQSRGIVLKPALKAAEVIVDASLLFSLLNTVLDWALAHAQSNIEFAIDIKSWPQNARLTCRFAHRPADQAGENERAPEPAALESLTWRLLEQTAWTMGLPLDRRDDALGPALAALANEVAAGSGPIVELGCSAGRGLWQLADAGASVIGIELRFAASGGATRSRQRRAARPRRAASARQPSSNTPVTRDATAMKLIATPAPVTARSAIPPASHATARAPSSATSTWHPARAAARRRFRG